MVLLLASRYPGAFNISCIIHSNIPLRLQVRPFFVEKPSGAEYILVSFGELQKKGVVNEICICRYFLKRIRLQITIVS